MGKGDGQRPRSPRITKEQYDANYEAIFRTGNRTTEPGDSPDNGTASEVPQESGGQPDPQTQRPLEGAVCPVCGYADFRWQDEPRGRWVCWNCKFSHEGGR